MSGRVGNNGARARRPVNMNAKKNERKSTHWRGLGEEPVLDSEFAGPHVPMFSKHDGKEDSEDEEEELVGEEQGPKRHGTWAGMRGDVGNVLLLLFLYTLQGIPLGLTASIPLILQNRHITYAQQAVFSFAYWPFSLKLLWAPIVDSVYFSRIGRRKSWMVPTQYLIGIFMLVLSTRVTTVLGDHNDEAKPDILFLTGIFFAFNFLAATQDIAVDGWALTMLSKRNVGYASTCNAVGQTAGYFMGNVVFLALESAEFCNKYLRGTPQNQGLVTLADFVYFWGWIFLASTTLVLLFKKEKESTDVEEIDIVDKMGVTGTYKLLFGIMRLKPVFTLCFIHLTTKIGFAAADGITGLKLVELGLPKDKLAFIAIPLVPLQIMLPWIIGRYTSGPRPLSIFLKSYPYRLGLGLIFAVIVYITPSFRQADGHFPVIYYIMIIIVYCIHQVTVYSMFVALMAFHAQISDPKVGGTYMTLMNTVSNLGGNWPVTLALTAVDTISIKGCVRPTNGEWLGKCDGTELCTKLGGQCTTTFDGYYVLTGICSLIGVLWLRVMGSRMDRLHDVPKARWSKPFTPANLRNVET